MTNPSVSRILALVLCTLALTSCGLVEFDVEERIPEQTVQGSPLGGLLPAGLFQLPLQIDLQAKTKAQGTGPAKSASLKAITLTIVAPPGATFGFLDSLSIKIVADGLPEQEVARLAPVPATGTISLQIVPGINILPYVGKGATMTATATGRAPSQDTTLNGRVVVTIKV